MLLAVVIVRSHGLDSSLAKGLMQDNRIRPFTMPLMSLAATAIDQPKSREKVIETMLRYLDTDAICCREEPGKLADLQAKVNSCCHSVC